MAVFNIALSGLTLLTLIEDLRGLRLEALLTVLFLFEAVVTTIFALPVSVVVFNDDSLRDIFISPNY